MGACALILLLAGPAAAEHPNLKLGLWETTSASSGAPPIDLSNMPPESRAQIEAFRKAHPSRAGQPHVTRSCLTQDKLDKFSSPGGSDTDGCQRTVVKSSATAEDVKIECPNGAHGEGHFEFVSPELSKGNFDMTSTHGGDGKTSFSFKSQVTSKWISADCGDVK
jgi:hypothetical protein